MNNLKAFINNTFCNFIRLSLLIVFICTNSKVLAQQTIINAPSSDILPRGDMILKDSNKYGPINGYSSITPTIILGTGLGTELSVGVANSFNENVTVRSDIAAKKVWFVGSSSRVTVGGMVNPYLNAHEKPDSFLYTHFSHRIKKTKTSLTAGIYMHGHHGLPNKAGAIVGLEQVIIPNKLRLAIDWMSTPDSNGRLGAGFKYRPIPTLSITTAVIVPNDDSDNIAFNISFSKFISIKDTNLTKRRL